MRIDARLVAQHAVLFIPVIGMLDLVKLSRNFLANDSVQKFICYPASNRTLAGCLLPAWSMTNTIAVDKRILFVDCNLSEQ